MSDPLSAALAKAAEELEWQQGAVRSGDYDAAARVVIAAFLRAWPDQMLDDAARQVERAMAIA